MQNKKLLITIPILIFFLLIVPSCKKNKDDDWIPYVYVDFYINITLPDYIDLNVTGGWVYLNGGSRGIILYRKSDAEFAAYDRHCPYDPDNKNAIVEVDDTDIMVVDSTCGSKFQLLDGSVAKGPATRPLKEYRTFFDGEMVHVYN